MYGATDESELWEWVQKGGLIDKEVQVLVVAVAKEEDVEEEIMKKRRRGGANRVGGRWACHRGGKD